MKNCSLLADYLKLHYFDNIVITSKALENIKHDANSGLVEIVAFVKEHNKIGYKESALVASAIYRNGVAYVADNTVLSYGVYRYDLKEFITTNNLAEGIAYSNVIDYTNLEFEILSLDDESAKVRAKLVITFHSSEKLELISDIFRLKTAIIDRTTLQKLNDTLIELTKDFQDLVYSVTKNYQIEKCYLVQDRDDTITKLQYKDPYILEENCDLTNEYLVSNSASTVNIGLIHTNNGDISEARGILIDRIYFKINEETVLLEECTKQIIENSTEEYEATRRLVKLLESDFESYEEEVYLNPRLDKRCKLVAGSSEISMDIHFDITSMANREIEITSTISVEKYGEDSVEAFKQTDKINFKELDKKYYINLLYKIIEQTEKIIDDEMSMAEHQACIEFSEMYKFYNQNSDIPVSEYNIEINNTLDLVGIGTKVSKLAIMGAKIKKFNDNITLAVAADKLYVFCNSDTELHIRLIAHAEVADSIKYKELDSDSSARAIVPVIKSALALAAGYTYLYFHTQPNKVALNIIANGGIVVHVNKLRRWTRDECCGDIKL